MKLPAAIALTALVAAPLLFGPVAARAAADAKPDSIVLLFGSGSAAIRPEDEALLDKAARLYRDGDPIVMIVTGSSDSTGAAQANLTLSERRANAVVAALVSRGIPVQKLQVLGKGVSDPPVTGASGRDEEQNRRAEITWR